MPLPRWCFRDPLVRKVTELNVLFAVHLWFCGCSCILPHTAATPTPGGTPYALCSGRITSPAASQCAASSMTRLCSGHSEALTGGAGGAAASADFKGCISLREQKVKAFRVTWELAPFESGARGPATPAAVCPSVLRKVRACPEAAQPSSVGDRVYSGSTRLDSALPQDVQ